MNRPVIAPNCAPAAVAARPYSAAMHHGSFGMWRSTGFGATRVTTTHGSKRNARRSRRQPT